MSSALRRGGRPVAATLAVVAALLALLGLPATASADAPLRLPSQITDPDGMLDASGRADVQAALDALFDEHRTQLWVVYVASFGGVDADAWASRTVAMSGLGDEAALLAVATEDGAYAFDVPSSLSGVSESDVAAIERDAVVPALREGDWAGAAVSAAGGLSDAMSGTGSGSGVTYLVLGGVAVVAAGGAVLYTRRRKTRTGRGGSAAADVDWTDPAVLATLPIATLDARAKEVLVETDNAIRTSEEELNLARGEFGDAATAPFTAAYDAARSTLASAFAIRQRLDDDIPETPDQQRDMLVELIATCSRADRELNDRVTEFDGMRDLLIDAPARLDALTQRTVEMTVRIPESESVLTALRGEFPAPALASVDGNIALAREQLAYADQNITAGRDAVALPAGKQGPAVVAIRAAEGALDQVRELLDGVDHAADNIRTAMATLPAAIADARKDIADADALAGHGGPDLAAAKSAAEAAVAAAEATSGSDPLGAFTELAKADSALDTILAAANEAKANAERTAQRLTQDITAAQAQITAATDFVATRRGAVGAEARTRLSEAQRHLDAARQLSQSDPATALQHSRAAGDLSGRALRLAQSDVQQWEASRRPQSSGVNTGAILGGILIDSMIRGGRSGGWGNRGGGSRGGGRSPGSFGGPSSSGRISRSGRF
ncbi:TPM domain-containing protein [Rhodococcus sp. NPDC058505]|uniref:TPM domain-containing protein n=1 Tax=unclassified Rhodococcus (in: high G+C Gram-positive bacteria) TaxID=192944 RepID=UPI00365C2934